MKCRTAATESGAGVGFCARSSETGTVSAAISFISSSSDVSDDAVGADDLLDVAWRVWRGPGGLRGLGSGRGRLPRLAGELDRAPRSARSPGLPKTRVAGHRPQPTLELGHHQAAGCGQVDLLLSLRDPRRLQPLRGRLAGRAPGRRGTGQAVY